MYAPSRNEAREFLYSAWDKYRATAPLSALERVAVEIIALHPEYHALLEARERHIDADFVPDDGQVNPFLHLQLHLAIAEQLAVDRPQGIRGEVERLARAHGNEHDALHDALDCLGAAIWQAQRSGTPPDTEAYLDCLRRK
jgi:hypothetical protein